MLMKYMRWSYADLLVCPAAYVPVIADVAKREASDARAASRRR